MKVVQQMAQAMQALSNKLVALESARSKDEDGDLKRSPLAAPVAGNDELLQFREALEQFQRLHREQQSDRDLDLVGQAITRVLRQQQGGRMERGGEGEGEGKGSRKGKGKDGKEDKEGDEPGIEPRVSRGDG